MTISTLYRGCICNYDRILSTYWPRLCIRGRTAVVFDNMFGRDVGITDWRDAWALTLDGRRVVSTIYLLDVADFGTRVVDVAVSSGRLRWRNHSSHHQHTGNAFFRSDGN